MLNFRAIALKLTNQSFATEGLKKLPMVLSIRNLSDRIAA